MLVVTTPTGQIGRHVLARLVAAGEPVRAVARDRTRIDPELLARAEVVEGSIDDPATIGKALDEAEAVFWCIPPDTQVSDVMEYFLGFSRPFAAALAGSSVRRVVFVSSGGRGRAKDAGPISASFAVEELLEGTGVHLRALRCGSFMENMLHQVEPLRRRGMFSIRSMGTSPYPPVPPATSGRGPPISSATGRGRARPGRASTARPTCRSTRWPG